MKNAAILNHYIVGTGNFFRASARTWPPAGLAHGGLSYLKAQAEATVVVHSTRSMKQCPLFTETNNLAVTKSRATPLVQSNPDGSQYYSQ